jgi:hypothetical protein
MFGAASVEPQVKRVFCAEEAGEGVTQNVLVELQIPGYERVRRVSGNES